MTARRRRPADPLLLGSAVALVLVALLAACGPASTPRPAGSPTGSIRPSPDLTAVPGGPSGPVLGPTVGPPTTTKTEFGTIYDALPPSFPKLPGEEPADTGAGAMSGSFVVNLDAGPASEAMRAALVRAGWSVEVGSPLEDGTVVLEATGASEACKTEVRFTPRSGTVLMSVLYGASCPFS